jgi:hypothetical protein
MTQQEGIKMVQAIIDKVYGSTEAPTYKEAEVSINYPQPWEEQ